MSKNVLLLGAETKLGIEFQYQCEVRGHAVFSMDVNSDGGYIDDQQTFHWVVNCLGSNHLDRIGDGLGEDQHAGAKLLTMNVLPIYWVIDELVARQHPAARVLSVASQTYRTPQTHTAIYCASKAALVMLTRTMARELAPKGWVINAIAPGKIVDTDMAMLTDKQVCELRRWTPEEADAYAIRNIPMRRYTSRMEVCDAMLKILDLPPYINGTCIDMTGGA